MKRCTTNSVPKALVLITLGAFTALPTKVCLAQSAETPATETEFICDSGSPLQAEFKNGAAWQLCIVNRLRENLVLSNVRYTDVSGRTFPVLANAGISQLHVAYDASDLTYNDVTQFGLGNEYMIDLTEQDCPNGKIVNSGKRPATCVTQQVKASSHRTNNRRAQRESLNVFSVSLVGAYTYVLDWTLYDDGTIEPAVGATGALQRSSPIIEQPFGRVLSEDPDTQWLSHTHNYYWRLDFDLGDAENDDVVVETQQKFDKDGHRMTTRNAFTTEQARRIEPKTYQSWQLFENASYDSITNPARGYQIAPQHHGHRMTRPEVEPYTDYDIYITVAKDCERFASENSLFNPECDSHVLEFANDEPLENEDIVVWHRVAFHHVPRNEDQRHMHAHWDSFQITPLNISALTPSAANISNEAPTVAEHEPIAIELGEAVNVQLLAIDIDNDSLHFHAQDLPPGLQLSGSGLFTGTPTWTGDYITQVSVSDDLAQAVFEQRFTIGLENSKESVDGFFGSVWNFIRGLPGN